MKMDVDEVEGQPLLLNPLLPPWSTQAPSVSCLVFSCVVLLSSLVLSLGESRKGPRKGQGPSPGPETQRGYMTCPKSRSW